MSAGPGRARLGMTLEPLLGSTALYRAEVSWKYIIGTQWVLGLRGMRALPSRDVLLTSEGRSWAQVLQGGVQGYLAHKKTPSPLVPP